MPYVFRLLLFITFVFNTGCMSSLCDSSLDMHYNAYGGMRDRIDRVNGRVGSQFDPAAAMESATPSDGEIGDRGLPSTRPGPIDAMDNDDGKLTEELLEALEQEDDLPSVDTGEADST